VIDETEIHGFIKFAERLAELARAQILPRFRDGGGIDSKSRIAFDPVTDADREAERAMREAIRAEYPDHGIIGEEFGAERGQLDFRWVIDPVDGTRAFVCGVPTFATLIALEQFETPILGLIDQAFTGERWIGANGGCSYIRDGGSIACSASSCTELSGARLTTTDPRASGYFDAAEAEAFAELSSKTCVQRFSLDAYGYALLALGQIDLVIETSLKRHDWSALVPVVAGAGGVISGWDGQPLAESPRGRIVAAATPALHAAALQVLSGR
jgi:myo-inositol-1(or 4)-monophosphatase